MMWPELAPHVGIYVAATDADGGGLLAAVLASGPRGAHRVVVLDTATWARVASFPIASESKSGVTPIGADGDVLIVNDDHHVRAFRARTGEALWERAFPAPGHVRLVDAGGGAVLVLVVDGGRTSTRLLRSADGADDGVLPFSIHTGLSAAALGRDGTIVWGGMRSIGVLRAGVSKEWPIPDEHFGAGGPLAVSPDGSRVAFATRRNAVALLGLETGACTTALPPGASLRSLGFARGLAWALDLDGRLRFADGASLETGLDTYGGIVSDDGARLSLGDTRTRTFRVRRVADGSELFATTPGFSCSAACQDATGALLVLGDEKLIRVDPAAGKSKKLASGGSDLVTLADGSVAVVGASLRIVPVGESKPVPLARRMEDACFAAGRAFTWSELALEVWDLARRERTFQLDLAATWLGETGEAIRLVHAGPDGRPWVHTTDGAIHRADALDRDDALVGRLPKDGTLWLHPDGRTIHRVHDAGIQPIAVDGLTEGPLLPRALDAPVTKLVPSPTGARIAVRHRDGRLSVIDLAMQSAVAIASPKTSAAARGPNEIFAVDLDTPHGCAFGGGEATLVFAHGGGLGIADARTGALRGRVVVAPNGKDFVLSDGTSVDWPGGAKAPISDELVVLEGDVPLASATLRARRRPGLLAELLR